MAGCIGAVLASSFDLQHLCSKSMGSIVCTKRKTMKTNTGIWNSIYVHILDNKHLEESGKKTRRDNRWLSPNDHPMLIDIAWMSWECQRHILTCRDLKTWGPWWATIATRKVQERTRTSLLAHSHERMKGRCAEVFKHTFIDRQRTTQPFTCNNYHFLWSQLEDAVLLIYHEL